MNQRLHTMCFKALSLSLLHAQKEQWVMYALLPMLPMEVKQNHLSRPEDKVGRIRAIEIGHSKDIKLKVKVRYEAFRTC